jgi:hypothetical protein
MADSLIIMKECQHVSSVCIPMGVPPSTSPSLVSVLSYTREMSTSSVPTVSPVNVSTSLYIRVHKSNRRLPPLNQHHHHLLQSRSLRLHLHHLVQEMQYFPLS